MDDIREKLKPYLAKRIKIRGCLSKFDLWTDRRTNREIGRACISNPELDGEVIASHVWVMNVKHWPRSEKGKQVEFEAVVNQYADAKVGGNNYHLINPDDLHILHDPPAFRISDLPPDEDVRPQQEALPVPTNKPVTNDPLETVRQVRAFTKAVGGQEQAENVAKALEDVKISLPDLITWIKALGE
jgi:hypothetical protein